jgi:type IV secretory pathway VirB10-like protein
MRASTAYFAGAGTVVMAIVAGVGGGLLIADIISPKSPKQGTEMTRLERRMSPEPIQAAPGPSEPVQYLAAPQLSALGAAVAAAPAQAQTEAGNSQSAGAQPAETAAAAQPDAPAPQAATPAAQPVAHEQAAAPENALAKARDAEMKRAVEKRKLERRQQWAEKRRQRQQQELRAVEERVREETGPTQVFAAEPVRIEMPQIRLFGQE